MPLPCLHFINTRPSHYDDTLNDLGQGVQIWQMPLLKIVMYEVNHLIKNQINKLLSGHYLLLVIISPIAAQAFIKHLNQSQIAQLQSQLTNGQLSIIAVGNATKNTLNNIGLTAQSPPNENNEGMMTMLTVKTLVNNAKIAPQATLFCKGMGGRTKFRNFLIEQGVIVDELVLYERTYPDELPQQFANFYTQYQKNPNLPVAILISSEQAFWHWQQTLTAQKAWVDKWTYICLGERLGAIVGAMYDKVVIVRDLKRKSILSTCQQIINNKGLM